MHLTTKTWLTAILATAILATALGTASARNLSLSTTGTREVFSPLVFFNGEARLSCPVTMEGSFHYRTVAKTVGSLSGYITRLEVSEASCAGAGLLAGARARVLTETLPHHITYQGFRGTLPNIESIIFLFGTAFTLFNIALIRECSYSGTVQGFFFPATSEAEPDRTSGIPKTAGSSALCPNPGHFEGRSRVTALGTTTAVTVTLI